MKALAHVPGTPSSGIPEPGTSMGPGRPNGMHVVNVTARIKASKETSLIISQIKLEKGKNSFKLS